MADHIIRYTTPNVTIVVTGVDLSSDNVYVSFKQLSTEVVKTDAAVTSVGNQSTLVLSLTQEETAVFAARLPISVQVNWITQSGTRGATNIATVESIENLLDEVVSYGS